jgi:GDPmannose 4,6-dehydratase|tara:strand:- start:13772 stop:14779 length:1008 start_codon:yes stop_codon:yes gene_type:complete
MPKKVLITGITGMVGSHLLDYLYKKTNWNIYGIIRWRSPLENISSHIKNINLSKRIFLEYGDIREPHTLDLIIKNIKPDYVFHLAAQSYPKTSFDMPKDTYETNIVGTSNLLESLKRYKKNALIHVCSSSEVFGRVPKEMLPINEECNFHPASPYAISKTGTDLVARFYAEAYKMKIMTTRMFTHTGPRRGDVFAESSFAKQIAMIEAGMMKPVVKVGNLKSLRTVADVRDAVRAYYLLLTKNPVAGEVYNIGGSYTCTVEDILKFLISKSNKKIKYEVDKNRLRPIDADLQVPDTSKFKKHTGWQPEYKFERTMLDLLNYWRKKVNKKNFYLSR